MNINKCLIITQWGMNIFKYLIFTRWEDEDRFPEDNVSDTSSRDYPR